MIIFNQEIRYEYTSQSTDVLDEHYNKKSRKFTKLSFSNKYGQSSCWVKHGSCDFECNDKEDEISI